MGKKNNYAFIDKDIFKGKSKRLQADIKEMYESYYMFLDLLKKLREDGFIKTVALELRAGITDKLLDKITACVEEYQRIFIEMGTEILQTSLDDFMNPKP